MTRVYIISPHEDRWSTIGLMPGANWFKMQFVKGGPWIGVKTFVEPDGDEKKLDVDDHYVVHIGGHQVPWSRWTRMNLIGEQITEPEYNYVLKALDWDRVHLGLDERKAVDLMAMPPVAPPMSVACIAPKTEVEMPEGVVFVGTRGIKTIPLPCDFTVVEYIGLDTPASSALADAILPPIDVEIEE